MHLVLYTLKTQFKTLFWYLIFIFVPLLALGIYVKNIPYIPYFFIIGLFAFRLITENEKAYQK